MINVIFNILALAGLAIAGFGGFLIIQYLSRNAPIRGGVLITAVGLIIAIVFFIIGAGIIEVQPNEVAVVFNVLTGDLAETPLGPGLHVILPGIQHATLLRRAARVHHGRDGQRRCDAGMMPWSR